MFLGQKVWKKFGKNLEKVWKSLEKVWKSLEKVQKFRKVVVPNVREFRKMSFSELSEIYEKMTINSNFGNHEKLVLKSSECRALTITINQQSTINSDFTVNSSYVCEQG